MRAIVLVGGFGTRLRPLTLTVPKQLLPLAGTTMLEAVVGRLGDQGVDEVILSLGYRPDAFVERYPDGTCAGVRLVYAPEPEPLDTAGAIRFAAEAAGVNERFLALNGDVLTDLDLRGLVERHEAFGGEGTIALTAVEDPSRFGVVVTDPTGRVEAFIEKPPAETAPSRWINAGVYVLEPEVLERIPRGRRVSIERETFPSMVDDGVLFAVESSSYWVDAGTPETYLQAQLDLINGLRGDPLPAIDPSARIDAAATVEGSVIGPSVCVGPGAKVIDSVVMARAVVSAGCRIDQSIVGPGSVVGTGALLESYTVIGGDQVIGEGAHLRSTLVPRPEEW